MDSVDDELFVSDSELESDFDVDKLNVSERVGWREKVELSDADDDSDADLVIVEVSDVDWD